LAESEERMKRHEITRWLGACLLGSALVSGCEHANKQPASRASLGTPVAMSSRSMGGPFQYGGGPGYTVGTPTTTSLPAPTTVPVKAENPKPLPVEQPAVAMTPPSGTETVAWTGAGPEPATRKSFADITADSCFAHADDYHWLRGRVEYSHISKTWRLRYANVDETDKYGGSVTLTADRGLGSLKDGQRVTVQGNLLDTQQKGAAPIYQVESIQPVEEAH
jgi:hypothetical protein